MKKNLMYGIGLSTVTLLIGHVQAGSEPADVVMLDGKVYTVDAHRSVQQALAIRGNEIMAVGSSSDVKKLIGEKTQVIDLKGNLVLPGLIDAHVHPIWGSVSQDKCNLAEVETVLPKLKEAIQKCIRLKDLGANDWVEGVQLYNYGFKATADDLDLIEKQRPMVIYGNDGHTLWANTRALKEAGINSSTAAPEGGKIGKTEQGEPSGFFNDSALNLFANKLPKMPISKMADLTAATLRDMNRYGVTSLQDAWVDDTYLDVWKMLYETGRLQNMRVRTNIYLEDTSDSSDHRISELKAKREAYSLDSHFLRADGVKFFADGVVEAPSFSAALLKPYLKKDGSVTKNLGDLYFKQAEFNKLVARLDAENFSVQVHSIGDRATHSTLNAFEFAKTVNGPRGNRHMIAHIQLLSPQDRLRFEKLDVYPVMSLTWAVPDPSNTTSLKPYIGANRYLTLYAANSLKKSGATIVGGSDWDVSSYNPFIAMTSGVTRKILMDGPSLNIKEGIKITDMIDAYTINAAKALKQDSITGSIEAGKRADVVIVDRDILTIPAQEVMHAEVQSTYVNGKQVYYRQPGI